LRGAQKQNGFKPGAIDAMYLSRKSPLGRYPTSHRQDRGKKTGGEILEKNLPSSVRPSFVTWLHVLV